MPRCIARYRKGGLACKPNTSFGSDITILPRVEINGGHVNLLKGIGSVNFTPVFSIFTIILIHLQVTPGSGSDFTSHIEPFWGKLVPLGLPNSFFGSLSLLQAGKDKKKRKDNIIQPSHDGESRQLNKYDFSDTFPETNIDIFKLQNACRIDW